METVKNILKARGLTQADLAAVLKRDVATVNRWLNGEMQPRAESRQAISDFLGTTVMVGDGGLYALPPSEPVEPEGEGEA